VQTSGIAMMQTESEMPGTVAQKKPTPIVRDAEALFRRGVEALERDHFEEAAGSLQQAANLAPDSAPIQLALGIALLRLVDVCGAMNALERATELEPEGFYPHFRLGELYLRIGVPTKAREQLQRAIDLSSNSEERRMVRELIAIDDKRAARRIWRPNFAALLRKKSKPE
jgi:tetratricopeptide (TPR) repeat protein